MRYYVCVRGTASFGDEYTVSLNANGHPAYTSPGEQPLKFVNEDDAVKYARYAQGRLPRFVGQHERIGVREMDDGE